MKLVRSSGTLRLLALAVAAVTSPLAFAQESNWYIGGNVGRSAATIDDAGITNSLLGQGLTTSSISDRNRDTGYKLFGGYQFNKNIAVEGGYVHLGEYGFTANTVPTGTLNGDIRLKGINLDLVGRLPVTERFSLIGRLGVIYADASDSFAGTGAVVATNPNPNKRETNGKAGLGVEYAFSDALAMRLEGERYRINDAIGNHGHIDLVSVGLIYRFGEKAPVPAPRMVTPAPEPVRPIAAVTPEPAPLPAPTPVPPPPPPPPRFEKFTLSSTELFGFDSAELQMPQPKLDEIAVALNANRGVHDVVISGYTDRLGAANYNQKLSERRANAVKGYLTGKGVDANRLVAEGKGEANPVVVCTNKKQVDLIKCLEPNRRVEIAPITIERQIR